MKLFYKPGACSMAAHLVLNEAGATFQLEKVDTGAGLTETGGHYWQTNPRGYVPALQFESGEILTESIAILHWLGEQFPAAVSGQTGKPLDKVRQLEVMSFLAAELHKAFGPFFSGKDYTDAEKTENLKKLKTKIGQFDALLPEGGDFLFGSSFSVADAYAFTILNWTGFIGVPLSEWPKTEAYVARIRVRPAVQKTLETEGLAA